MLLFLTVYTAKIQYRKLGINVPRKGNVRPLLSQFHIHVHVSDLYIPTIGLPILLQENMWTDPGNIWIAQTHSCGKWGLGPRSSFSMNTQMGFSLQCTIWYDVPNSDICRGRKRPTVTYVLKIFCFIYFQDRSTYSAAGKYVDQSWEYINCSQTPECGNWDWDLAIPR